MVVGVEKEKSGMPRAIYRFYETKQKFGMNTKETFNKLKYF